MKNLLYFNEKLCIFNKILNYINLFIFSMNPFRNEKNENLTLFSSKIKIIL